MRIYRGTVTLLDYLFFATVERGKIYETGAFIHNYALAYALRLIQAETYTYANLKQRPQYAAELPPLHDHLYLTPATPLQISYRLVQWNTLPESYAFGSKPPSIGYPDWGFARLIRPESAFVFYLLRPDPAPAPLSPALETLLAGQPARIRLGKFNGKARLELTEADRVGQGSGPFQTDTLLNWRDLGPDPLVCDVVAASLPTRLINHSRFDEARFYEAEFGKEKIKLPQDMRFLARLPQSKKRGKK